MHTKAEEEKEAAGDMRKGQNSPVPRPEEEGDGTPSERQRHVSCVFPFLIT